MTVGASRMTAATRFTPATVRSTRASVRFAPGSAPLIPGPDDIDPASVAPSDPGSDDVDAPTSSGPVSAQDAEPGAEREEASAEPADEGAPLPPPRDNDTRPPILLIHRNLSRVPLDGPQPPGVRGNSPQRHRVTVPVSGGEKRSCA